MIVEAYVHENCILPNFYAVSSEKNSDGNEPTYRVAPSGHVTNRLVIGCAKQFGTSKFSPKV